MSSMDGLRSQLAAIQSELRDVVGRLNALESERAPVQVPVTPKIKSEVASAFPTSPTTIATGTRKP